MKRTASVDICPTRFLGWTFVRNVRRHRYGHERKMAPGSTALVFSESPIVTEFVMVQPELENRDVRVSD